MREVQETENKKEENQDGYKNISFQDMIMDGIKVMKSYRRTYRRSIISCPC